jgi:hypothetical protein
MTETQNPKQDITSYSYGGYDNLTPKSFIKNKELKNSSTETPKRGASGVKKR